MEGLPPDVAAAIARGVGAYVGAVPRHQLPNQLRPLQAFRAKALAARSGVLIAALDDDTFRNAVLDWLDEVHPDLPPEDQAILRLACEREDGWEEQLRALGAEDDPEPVTSPAPDTGALEAAAARERERAKQAREEARRAKAALADERAARDREIAALRSSLAEAEEALQAAAQAKTEAERERDEAASAADKEVRRARRSVEAAEKERDAARRDLKVERRAAAEAAREVERLERRVADLEREVADLKERREPDGVEGPRRQVRRSLPVPMGRFDDDPQTLETWLDHDGVRVVVDGYNVTLAERGFGKMELEQQRERLVTELGALVRRKGVGEAIVVFDGNVVAPAARRAFRGPVKVEYSRPGEKADDHLVALLDVLPPDPVVAVTNDRELQERLREKGATVATSDQLLDLLR